jgi:hypothetical protein
MPAHRDTYLSERGIGAEARDGCASYLFVPGQLVVGADDAEVVRADLQRRGLLGELASTAEPAATAALDVEMVTKLSRLVDPRVIAEAVKARRQSPKEPATNQWLEPPGLDPAADGALEELGLVRLALTPDADIAALVTAYRAEGLDVAPNHVIHMEQYYKGMPGDLPRPADHLDAPKGAATGPRVVILDTGIQKGWDTDDWFRDRVEGAGGEDLEVLDADSDGVLDIQAGHGTFIASLVAAGCPEATILPRRVLNSFGLTCDSDLAAAIMLVARKLEPDILVLSLGAYTADDRPLPAVARALAHLPERTVVVAAAGNAGHDRVFWPAAMKTVVAVGAHDAGSPRRRAWFSNFGWWVDACADGVDVHAKFVEWDGGLEGVPDPVNFEGFAVWSGTSFAAPVVAAALARHMAANGGTAHEAVRALIRRPGLPQLVDLGTVVDA